MNRLLLLLTIIVNISCIAQKSELLDVVFCYDIPNNDASKVYANITVRNVTNKTVGYLADIGYVINPQVIFGISDSIVSDTLCYNFYHPQYLPGVYDRCFDCSNDSTPVFTYLKKEVIKLKRGKSNTIKFVFPKSQFALINHVKIIIYNFYITKKGPTFFEKKIYIISKPFDCNNANVHYD